MARPIKKGLDYFPFDVNFFSNKKIKRLRAKFGNDGVMVYIYLLCEIYRKCYYTDYDEDLILDIADELNISENSTKQILNYLLSRSLFDDKLAKSVKVLTAESIQRRYLKAKCASENAAIEDRYLLLKNENVDTSGEAYPKNSFCENNEGYLKKNLGYFEKNHTKESKEKKSKVKESKGEETAAPSAPQTRCGRNQCASLTEESYRQLVYDYGEKNVETYLERADEWAFNKNKKLFSCHAIIRKWLEQDNVPKTDHSVDKYKCVINQFQKE